MAASHKTSKREVRVSPLIWSHNIASAAEKALRAPEQRVRNHGSKSPRADTPHFGTSTQPA